MLRADFIQQRTPSLNGKTSVVNMPCIASSHDKAQDRPGLNTLEDTRWANQGEEQRHV